MRGTNPAMGSVQTLDAGSAPGWTATTQLRESGALREISPELTPFGWGNAAGAPTVSALVIRALVYAAEHAGVSSEAFLRAASLDPQVLENPDARLPLTTAFKLCELVIDLTGDPAFGLHWAEWEKDRLLDPVPHLLTHCTNVRQGLRLLARFFHLLCDDGAYRVLEHDGLVTVHCAIADRASSRTQWFVAEMMVGGFLRYLRTCHPDARPHRACFAYPAPAHRAEYTRVFAGRERFAQPFTALVFDRALLDATSPHQDDDVCEALQSVAERRLLRISQRTPYAIRVRDFLVREGFPHRTDMESVARALGMSVRSLRRRLEAEGKAYNDILSEARATTAKRLLDDPRRSIQEIAYDMGFADPNTFSRAFKRWTGMTPSACRRALWASG